MILLSPKTDKQFVNAISEQVRVGTTPSARRVAIAPHLMALCQCATNEL